MPISEKTLQEMQGGREQLAKNQETLAKLGPRQEDAPPAEAQPKSIQLQPEPPPEEDPKAAEPKVEVKLPDPKPTLKAPKGPPKL